jgi:hypothetical protein
MEPNGTMVVQLKRALYGCIESARLWYQEISTFLESTGFSANPHDCCVFNRLDKDGRQTTLLLHVDDMKVIAPTEEGIDNLLLDLQKRFPKLVVKRGQKLNYLGMVFDYSVPGKCKVTMDGFIADLLEECSDMEGVSDTPATSTLFVIDESSPALAEVERQRFHSLVAKLLYLSKRSRPDLLVSTAFLTTRVLCATTEDWGKLERVIKYLRGTPDLGITLEADKFVSVTAYVDASFAVHRDAKSHTGLVVSLGKGPVLSSSSRQKLVTKSSTESELVGLSDSSGSIIWMRNFLLCQGFSLGPATVMQDNKSTMALVANARSNSARTRHIAIRYFFVSDRVQQGELKIEYLPTGDMIADILTKPLVGEQFKKLRKALLNTE